MAVASGSLTVGTVPTKVCTMGESGALVFASATGVFIGGPAVATSGANLGVPLAATTLTAVPGTRTVSSLAVPSGADNTCDLFCISTAGTQTISFLTPLGG